MGAERRRKPCKRSCGSASGLAVAFFLQKKREKNGVAEILGQIRTAQDEFVKASDDFTAASSAKTESASSVKKPLVSAINDRLVPYLTAMEMANGTVYADFALKIKKEISRVNETVSRRGK